VQHLPGDLLLKNFRADASRRVRAFYDYDELCFVTTATSGSFPSGDEDDGGGGGEATFYVARTTSFPRSSNLHGPPGEARTAFHERHEELLRPRFWLDDPEAAAGGGDSRRLPLPGIRRLPTGSPPPPDSNALLWRKGPHLRSAPEEAPKCRRQAEGPAGGAKITISGGQLKVPDNPIIPFIEGDGTGRDIWRSSVRVLDAAWRRPTAEEEDPLDGVSRRPEVVRQPPDLLPEETTDAFRDTSSGSRGRSRPPIGGGIRSLNVALRQILDLYVCCGRSAGSGRPVPVKKPGKVDMVIFRENTEDIYAGIEFAPDRTEAKKVLAFLKENFPPQYKKIRFPDTTGIGFKPVSRRTAASGSSGRPSSTRSGIRGRASPFVHKGNIMKYTEGAFRNYGYALAESEFADKTYTWDKWERTKKEKGEPAANRRAEGGAGQGKAPR